MDNGRLQPKSAQAVELLERMQSSGRNQRQMAEWLTLQLGRKIENYHVSRWLGDTTKIPLDVMDALRRGEGFGENVLAPFVPPLTETAEVVPLYAYSGAVGAALRLVEAQRVGAAPIHPRQQGSKSAFAVVVTGDAFSPRLRHGDIAYAIRDMTPTKGEPCVVELQTGEALIRIFDGLDERTLFCSQLTPKKELNVPRRDVVGVHAIVGVSFGGV